MAAPADNAGKADNWHRIGQHEGAHYRFDRAGNLTHRKEADGTLTTLAWDANQRLIASTRSQPGAPTGEIETTTYAYDPLGRRLWKETAGKRTWFGWDGDALALDVIDGKAREFVYRPESFEPLALLGATPAGELEPSSPLFYLNDPNGAPTRLIDQSGRVMWAASYTAWGGINHLHENRVDNPIRLQGQYADQETGLHYNRHRYFEAGIGGFVSQDPIGLIAGEEIYGLAKDVWNWIDPLGLTCSKPTKYHKRTVAAVAKLREAFEKAGGAKEKFLKSLAKDPDAIKKFGKEAVDKMKKGNVPTDKVVHHKKPLFRGGTNKQSNFALMDKAEHQQNNKILHWHEEGMNPFGLN